MLSEEKVKQFQEIYEKETGEKISLEEASECAEKLINLVRLVYKPIKRADYLKWQKEENCSII